MPTFNYVGAHAFHLVIVTRERRRVLLDGTALHVAHELMAGASATDFDVLIYTIMPDHVHVLVQGLNGNANVIRLVQRWKQKTSFGWKREHGEVLWQQSFFDRIVRGADDVRELAAYILDNPRRAGLLAEGEVWAHQGGLLLSEIRRS